MRGKIIMAEDNSNNSSVNYSVVIPVFNSSRTLPELLARLKVVLSSLHQSFEIILVDDSSRDNSWNVLRELKKGDPQLRIIRLSRNFGQHNAIMCGFHFCRGEYLITIDDDLQIPPEEIPKLITKAGEGYDVVYGIYEKKRHSRMKNFGSAFINWYYRKVFSVDNKISSFRLISRPIVQEISKYDKNFPYIDGLISWHTREVGEVVVRHAFRREGRSGYTLGKILKLAFNMITNFSAFPIRLGSLAGVVFSFLGFMLGIYFFIKAFVTNIPVTGYASLIVAITIFSGAQLLTIGIIGEYIARVHLNINRQPQYMIKEKKL